MNTGVNSEDTRQDPLLETATSPPAKRRSGWLVLTAVLVAIVVFGVQMRTPATYRWKEEVQLHDGRLIVVERSRVMSGPREPFRSATVGKWTLAFENPDKLGMKIALEVHGGAAPMLLGFVGGVPYVAINPRRGDAQYFYNCPDPPYILFRYDGEWKRIELRDFPRELVNRNLPSTYKEYRELSEQGGMIKKDQITKIINRDKDQIDQKIVRPYGDETQYDCNRPGALHAVGSTPPTVASKEQVANEPKTNITNGRK